MLLTATALLFLSGFQETEWGMRPAEVIRAQKIAPNNRHWSNRSNSLTTTDRIIGEDVEVTYYFTDKKLAAVSVQFKARHSNANMYIEDYIWVKSKLKMVYGKPDHDEAVWRQDHYQGRPQMYGFAVLMGHLLFREIWLSEDVGISHKLSGDNMRPLHVIYYYSSEIDLDVNAKEDL